MTLHRIHNTATASVALELLESLPSLEETKTQIQNAVAEIQDARRMWLTNKKIAALRILEDIDVAAVYGPHTAGLNLDGGLLCCGQRGYTRCRTAGTEILLNTAGARGLKHDYRNNLALTLLMVITRGTAPALKVVSEHDVLLDDEGRTPALATLEDVFRLQYSGKFVRRGIHHTRDCSEVNLRRTVSPSISPVKRSIPFRPRRTLRLRKLEGR